MPATRTPRRRAATTGHAEGARTSPRPAGVAAVEGDDAEAQVPHLSGRRILAQVDSHGSRAGQAVSGDPGAHLGDQGSGRRRALRDRAGSRRPRIGRARRRTRLDMGLIMDLRSCARRPARDRAGSARPVSREGAALLDYDRGQAAGGDDVHRVGRYAELLDHPGHDPVDLPANRHHARLEPLDGVLGDHRAWTEQLDLAELGTTPPSASREMSMPGEWRCRCSPRAG